MWVREVAFLLHCHSHHHQSANCSAWERTSLHVVSPCLHPVFSRSLPTSHTRSSTSLTFTPHFPCHSSSSLSSSLRAVPPPPFSTTLFTLFTPLTSSLSRSYVNWFSLCVMQMFGLVSVAFPDGIHFAFHKTDSDGAFLWIMLLCLWSMAWCCYESWMSSDKKQKQSVKEFEKKKKKMVRDWSRPRTWKSKSFCEETYVIVINLKAWDCMEYVRNCSQISSQPPSISTTIVFNVFSAFFFTLATCFQSQTFISMHMCIYKQKQGMWPYTNQSLGLQYDLWLLCAAVGAQSVGKSDISRGRRNGIKW